MGDYDSAWKEALDVYFEPFLALFFPQAHTEISWSRGYESLDKELQKIVPESQHGRRVADKLVKVWLTDGREQEHDANPFATVVLAHLAAIQTRHAEAERYAWKFRLIKGLYQRGLARDDVRQLFRLIDWFMDLPEPLEVELRDEVTRYEQEKHMPYVTSFERIGLSRGRLEGIELALRMRFGERGSMLLPEIRQIHDEEKLKTILDAIESVSSPDELRHIWAG